MKGRGSWLLGLAFVLAMVPAQGASAASRCAKTGSSTIAENSLVRVYRFADTSNGRALTYHSCLKSNGRRVRMAIVSERRKIKLVRLTKQFVGFRSAIDGDTDFVSFVNAATSRRPTTYATEGEVRSLAINKYGYLAWTVDNYADPPMVSETLWAITEFSGKQLFDYAEYEPGAAMPITNLSFSGGVLKWKHNGEPRSRTTVGV